MCFGEKKMTDLVCPECKTRLDRKLGLPGIVCVCPKCSKEWIKCVDRLVSRQEFHAEADRWHN